MASEPRQVRLVDIAAQAGVSRRTVSCVLLGTGAGKVRVNADTAQRIRDLAQKLNYRPNFLAQQLTGKPSGIIGIMVENLTAPAHADIVQRAEERASELGYGVVVGHTLGREDRLLRYLDDFSRRRVDGVISLEWEMYQRSAAATRWYKLHPHAVFYGVTPAAGGGCVEPDRSGAVRLLVRHLQEKGRKRIGLLLDSLKPFSSGARREGYQAELNAGAAPTDRSLCLEIPAGGLPTEVQIEQVIDRLVVNARADALIAYDDTWALLLMKHLKRRRIEPGRNVAVAGIGNLPAGLLVDPELTTVDMRYACVAAGLVEMVDRMIRNGRLPVPERRALVEPKLLVRSST